LPLKEIEPLVGLPESFDVRENWPGCESVHEVRD